ncbi:unnamed protein product, partial [marine sediment metagenome]
RGVKDRWYDKVYHKAGLKYRFSDRIDLSLSAREDWNKDNMSKFGKSLLTTDYEGAVRYKPSKNLFFNAGLGHIYDRRFENEDSGSRVHGRLRYDPEFNNNARMDLSGSGQTSNLKRANDVYQVDGKLSYDHDLANISLREISYFHNRRGYFSDVDRKSIEDRDRTRQTIEFAVSRGDFYHYREPLTFEFTVSLERKQVKDSANDDPKSTKYKNNARGLMKRFGFRLGRRLGPRSTAEWGMNYGKK